MSHSTDLKFCYLIRILKCDNLFIKIQEGKASIPGEFKMNPTKQKVNYTFQLTAFWTNSIHNLQKLSK